MIKRILASGKDAIFSLKKKKDLCIYLHHKSQNATHNNQTRFQRTMNCLPMDKCFATVA